MDAEGASECLYCVVLCSARRMKHPEMEMKEAFLEGEAEGMVCRKNRWVDRFSQR